MHAEFTTKHEISSQMHSTDYADRTMEEVAVTVLTVGIIYKTNQLKWWIFNR